MNCYIESCSTDPCYNLALEQFIFDSLERSNSYIMLWQNHNSIIVGKHQNTMAEINSDFVKDHNISVVRRLSGGGAVYHDLGNLNFTFITDTVTDRTIDFAAFCIPIQSALVSLGVPAVISGRNDMTVDGKKFSGNAQYIREDRVMHHGTILYDSDLSVLSRALNPPEDKIESKGIKSVQSRVTNIKPYMKRELTISEFQTALKEYLFNALNILDFYLTSEHHAHVEKLKENRYSQWRWNYGSSPPYNLHKVRRIEGCGKIEILLDIANEGIIKSAEFYGDFFGSRDPAELKKLLSGHHLEHNELRNILEEIDIQEYFHGLDCGIFLSLLLSN